MEFTKIQDTVLSGFVLCPFNQKHTNTKNCVSEWTVDQWSFSLQPLCLRISNVFVNSSRESIGAAGHFLLVGCCLLVVALQQYISRAKKKTQNVVKSEGESSKLIQVFFLLNLVYICLYIYTYTYRICTVCVLNLPYLHVFNAFLSRITIFSLFPTLF